MTQLAPEFSSPATGAGLHAAAPRPEDPYRSPAYGWYVVWLFTAVQTCNMIDRSVIALTLESLQREFQLSDSQLGTLAGLGFGITYASFSLIYATFIDRTVRRTFLAIAITAWSLCTFFSGMVQSFAMLLIARMGVGAFEAGGSPTMMSMIPDIVHPRKLATAVGIFYVSATVGVVTTFLMGGIVVANYGWRTAFYIAGAAGLVLAPLVLFTVNEPVRGAKVERSDIPRPKTQGLLQALRYLFANPTMWILLLGITLTTTAASAVGVWIASFFTRIHHFQLTSIGLLIALGFGAFGTAGTAIWGAVADRWAVRNSRARLLMSLFALFALVMAGWAMCYVPSAWGAVAAFCVYCFFSIAYMGPLYSVFLAMTPPHMSGAMMFVMSIGTTSIGYGVGPWAGGLLSDFFGGDSSLQHAFATMLSLNLIACALIIYVDHRMRREAR